MRKGADDEATLVRRGWERQTKTLRAKIFWALVGMVLSVSAPALLFATTGVEVWSLLGGAIAGCIAAIWISDYLMIPIYVLRKRLELKNYGAEPPAKAPQTEVDIAGGGFDLGAWLHTGPTRAVDIDSQLPVELAAVERLARAGRGSELAMESIKRDLFRHLSHQLKSPLALMLAHAKTAAHALDRGEKPAVVESLKSIEVINLNTSGLVETMLSLAWVETLEEQGLGRQKANLSLALMDVVSPRERDVGSDRIRVVSHVEAGLWVRGNRQLLQEMFACLVDNALRYGPASKAVSVEARRIPSSQSVIVTVVDEGPGIPTQQRERVFEPFYGSIGLDTRGNMTYGTRIHRALGNDVAKSSHGLGLALVRAVAKFHGAVVTLDTGPGGIGLCVRVVLAAALPPDAG